MTSIKDLLGMSAASNEEILASKFVYTQLPVVSKEERLMNQPVAAVTTTLEQIFADRREWTPTEWVKRIDATEEAIKGMSPRDAMMDLLSKGTVRITNDSSATRKEGLTVVYSNKVQDDQMGRMLALREHIKFAVTTVTGADGLRVWMLKDQGGAHNVNIHEMRDLQTGRITYDCFYARVDYNNKGEEVLRDGQHCRVQDGIFDKVVSYNEWVDKHNNAALAAAQGTATLDQMELLGARARQGANPNNFVQVNSIPHISYGSIINKYMLLAWVTVAEAKGLVAFELHCRAKDVQAFAQFIEGRTSSMQYGYQAQLKVLAGIPYQPEA